MQPYFSSLLLQSGLEAPITFPRKTRVSQTIGRLRDPGSQQQPTLRCLGAAGQNASGMGKSPNNNSWQAGKYFEWPQRTFQRGEDHVVDKETCSLHSTRKESPVSAQCCRAGQLPPFLSQQSLFSFHWPENFQLKMV